MTKTIVRALAATLLTTMTSGLGGGYAIAATVQLSKVRLDTETNPATIRLKGGTLCVFPSNITLDKMQKTEDYERFDNLFTARMKLAGYRVVTTSQDLFAAADAEKAADFLIGATMRPENSNLCSSVSGWKGLISLSIEWQVYDRAARKVVETIVTPGKGERVKFAQNGYVEMWNSAFTESLGALVDQGLLKKYLGEPDAQIAADAKAAVAAREAAEAAAIAAAEAAKAAKRAR
jgi:hypothetical protein